MVSQFQTLSEEIAACRDTDYAKAIAFADDGAQAARVSHNASAELHFLILAIDIRRYVKDYAGGEQLFDQAFVLAKSLCEPAMSARLHYFHAIYGSIAGRPIEGRVEELLTAKTLAATLTGTNSDKDLMAQIAMALSSAHYYGGDYSLSLSYAEESLAYNPSQRSKVQALMRLADINTVIDDFATAAGQYQVALELMEGTNFPHSLDGAKLGLGFCLMQQKDYENAQRYFERLIAEDSPHRQIALLYSGKIYTYIRDYPRARKRIGECLSTCSEFEVRQQATLLMAEVLIHVGEVTEALETLCQLESTIEDADHTLKDVLFGILSEAYEVLGDWHRSLHYLKQKNIVKDEMERTAIALRSGIADRRIRMERERLETERHKSRAEQLEQDLTSKALQLAAQAELIGNVRSDLQEAMREVNIFPSSLKKLQDRLKTLPCKSMDWKKFDTQFKAVHPAFIERLTTRHEGLSAGDVRLCSLVRMQMKSEEIARLFCISHRSVETHRFRIRKKLRLDRGEDLAVYLTTIEMLLRQYLSAASSHDNGMLKVCAGLAVVGADGPFVLIDLDACRAHVDHRFDRDRHTFGKL